MKPAIIIVGYNRPNSIKRLLSSIDRAHFPNDTTLIISIDKSDNSEVYKVAESFRWEYGNKKLLFRDQHLGLRNHIILCGDLTYEYGAVILLEEDLFVSPYFYKYALEAADYYKDDREIAGVSLYSNKFNETAQLGFCPLYDESDVYYMQFASSWGQCWTYDQWKEFKDWYIENGENEFSDAINLPHNVIRWPKTSWKKYFIKYMVDNNKFFVFPRKSLTTNFGDFGVHHQVNKQHLQVPLQLFNRNNRFNKKEDSISVYDSFCEILPDCLKVKVPQLKKYDFEMNLYGQKKLNQITSEFVFIDRESKNPIMTFGRDLKPAEMNIIYQMPGNSLSLTEKSNCKQSIKIATKKDFLYYFNIPEEHFDQIIMNKERKMLRLPYRETFRNFLKKLKANLRSVARRISKFIRKSKEVWLNYLIKFIQSVGFTKKKNHQCNICNYQCDQFDSNEWHKYIICPNCKSQVRHRLVIAALTQIEPYNQPNFLNNKIGLHFGPEKFLRPFFQKNLGKYITTDLLAPGYSYKGLDLKLNLSNMEEVDEGGYDFCIAIDVLEHIPDHLNAMKEMYRVLKKEGYAILSVPQKDNLEITLEEPKITNPEERLKAYGQKDHLRIYGLDFKNMLELIGFKVDFVDEGSFPKGIAEKYVLFPPVLSKREFATNFRKIYFAKK